MRKLLIKIAAIWATSSEEQVRASVSTLSKEEWDGLESFCQAVLGTQYLKQERQTGADVLANAPKSQDDAI